MQHAEVLQYGISNQWTTIAMGFTVWTPLLQSACAHWQPYYILLAKYSYVYGRTNGWTGT